MTYRKQGRRVFFRPVMQGKDRRRQGGGSCPLINARTSQELQKNFTRSQKKKGVPLVGRPLPVSLNVSGGKIGFRCVLAVVVGVFLGVVKGCSCCVHGCLTVCSKGVSDGKEHTLNTVYSAQSGGFRVFLRPASWGRGLQVARCIFLHHFQISSQGAARFAAQTVSG